MKKLVLYTAGAGSREILLAVRDINRQLPSWEPLAFVDEDEAIIGTIVSGLPVFGPDHNFGTRVHGICGAWNPEIRQRMTENLIEGRGQSLATIVHPSVLISDDLQHGPGLVLMPGVKVSFDVQLGKCVLAMWNCMLGHGLRMADYATVLTGATILAECRVGLGATVGGGAVLNSGAQIERGGMVGVGTTLLHKVKAGQSLISMPRQLTRNRADG